MMMVNHEDGGRKFPETINRHAVKSQKSQIVTSNAVSTSNIHYLSIHSIVRNDAFTLQTCGNLDTGAVLHSLIRTDFLIEPCIRSPSPTNFRSYLRFSANEGIFCTCIPSVFLMFRHVVRVSGYRYRGPRFDPRRYQIF
jgi:hypothetical protein